MSERELIEPHKGDKRYQRRNEDGTFGESDDVSESLSQDVKQHAKTKKPRNEATRATERLTSDSRDMELRTADKLELVLAARHGTFVEDLSIGR
ncbi:hypothetical protein [Sphingosinicella humi]|uniref:Uncharacterized protein n=1 Tax=Allosphingosinicella humi TaxID=2068657 RepID=A0A2U2J2N5_9SPHN|nr:hypothetical protein [Sphingosinicella humi]PWG02610.1 hypothetical protein DF286_06820 [Sphingosinicella humi]